MKFVDLHCHSNASDGTLTPQEVVRLAKQNGLTAVALTDHDTVAGISAAASEARKLGIDFLPGIEISCDYPRPGTMHLLGYGIDPQNRTLSDLTKALIEGREKRNELMVRKFNEIGIPLTMQKVLEQSGEGVVGRPHFAAALVKMGVVSTHAEAFKTYLGQGGRVYVDKERLSSAQAIGMIGEAGGVCVLAHPSQLHKENNAQLESTIKDLADQGLAGIEVIHSDHRESLIDFLDGIADKYHLLKTGGSDFHGGNKPHITLGKAGNRRIPRQYYDELIAKLKSMKAARSPVSSPGVPIEEEIVDFRHVMDSNESIPHRDPITDPFASSTPAPADVASREADAAGDVPLNVDELNTRFENSPPREVVDWAISRFGPELVMSSSFGAESALLIHMATQRMPDIRIVMVDTGYLFAETHTFMAELRQRFSLNVLPFRTTQDPIHYLQQAGEDNPAERRDIDACCGINKNEPFDRAMKNLAPKAWLRGIRRQQSDTRKNRTFIEWSRRFNCWAISPMLKMTSKDIFDYMKKHELPYHPLYEKGYMSIGCSPITCTRPIIAGEDPRAGRWSGSGKIECGLNVDDSMDSSKL